MAVVNYYYPYKLSITCTATPPTSQDNSNNNPLLPTKIILPKKKPLKWSTGVAPGEYGGPPVTTELRRYWGGEKEDPITSDEYIWNNDFMPRMKRLLDPPDDNLPQFAPTEDETSGFLNLSRAMSLDSMEVDLSKELTTSKPITEKQVEVPQDVDSVLRKWRPAPTRREQKKWDQAAKGATGGSDLMLRELKRPKGDPAVLAAESREQYMQLKKKLQTLTVGIGAIGLVTTYISYSPEIATSYGAGFIGALAYVRMLGNSIDSMADGARGVLKGAIGQPRLLVPVVLVMIYNRWNGILVPEYGFMHLELIPMLVGFFTYKIATFTQALEAALPVAENNTQV